MEEGRNLTEEQIVKFMNMKNYEVMETKFESYSLIDRARILLYRKKHIASWRILDRECSDDELKEEALKIAEGDLKEELEEDFMFRIEPLAKLESGSDKIIVELEFDDMEDMVDFMTSKLTMTITKDTRRNICFKHR